MLFRSLHLDSGISAPLGEFASVSSSSSSGGATLGNSWDIVLGSNFKSSNLGWIATGFIGSHGVGYSSMSSGQISVSYGHSYPHSGYMAGLTYRLPVGKKRSAFLFALQLGSLTSTSLYVRNRVEQQTPLGTQSTEVTRQSATASGFLFSLGADYRLQFARKWYLLGKMNYQTASLTANNVTTSTTLITPDAQGNTYYSGSSANSSLSFPYSALNLQLGIGLFLK